MNYVGTESISNSSMDENCGEIQIIIGAMYSGKSSELLRRFRLYKLKYNSCIIKYKDDIRYSNSNVIVTHDKLECKDNVIFCEKDLLDCYENILTNNYDVICIDEGQFFINLVQFCEYFANKGKIVIVAGLDGDFNRKSFGEIVSLIPMAEKVTKLSAICDFKECKSLAPFTHRHKYDNTHSDSNVLIGGKEIYKPYCRKHYNLNNIDLKKF